MRRGSIAPAVVAATLAAVASVAAAPAPAAQAPAPRLVVVVVVDQMRADYVERFDGQWTAGLRRLVDQGAWFREAAYPYFDTVTCAGHATVGTGSFPATHGMILNQWWDRAAKAGRTCTQDPGATLVSYGAPAQGLGESGRSLAVPTLADELRAQEPAKARVVTLSLKARAAIGLAGHGGDAVTWLDRSGSWVTSTAYSPEAVPFVRTFAETHAPAADYGKSWTRLLPASDYFYADDAPEEAADPAARVFPHRLVSPSGKPDGRFLGAWATSPYSDAALGDLAVAAVDALHLGKGPGTDFLGISFSALDYVGHRYGPRSQEVQDVLVHLDRTLGKLLDHLDRTVGADHYVVAFTGDHGVAEIPEQAAAKGIEAGRFTPEDVLAPVQKLLDEALGPGHAVHLVSTQLYFPDAVRTKLAADPGLLARIEDAIRAVPGIAAVYRPEDLRLAAASLDPLERAAALSYFRGRSGDLIVLPKPDWLDRAAGTTHGSGYAYDQRVPLLLLGTPFAPGPYWDAASPADIAPTFAALCHVTLPRPDGHVLAEAFRK